MAKRLTEVMEIDVPSKVVYEYYKENFRAIISSKGSYESLKRHEFEQIEDIPNKKLAFQEKYLFTRATHELKLEKKGPERTKVHISIEVSWSPFRKKISESLLLGVTSNLRSLERMYRIIEEHQQSMVGNMDGKDVRKS